jgi:hypothetical protein
MKLGISRKILCGTCRDTGFIRYGFLWLKKRVCPNCDGESLFQKLPLMKPSDRFIGIGDQFEKLPEPPFPQKPPPLRPQFLPEATLAEDILDTAKDIGSLTSLITEAFNKNKRIPRPEIPKIGPPPKPQIRPINGITPDGAGMVMLAPGEEISFIAAPADRMTMKELKEVIQAMECPFCRGTGIKEIPLFREEQGQRIFTGRRKEACPNCNGLGRLEKQSPQEAVSPPELGKRKLKLD